MLNGAEDRSVGGAGCSQRVANSRFCVCIAHGARCELSRTATLYPRHAAELPRELNINSATCC
jgi:hypothetical protein